MATLKMLLLASLVATSTGHALDAGILKLPLTVEVTQDVPVKTSTDGDWSQRGTLYSTTETRIEKGQRFQMIEIGNEGGCRISFQGLEYEIFSCPWLPGFSDQQKDIFLLLPADVHQ